MKISCVQMDMRLGDVEYNFAHAQDLVRLAVDRDGPDVVVLPETWNTGFFPKDLDPCADRDGERTKLVFSSLARELDVNIVCGSVANRKGDGYYNTAYVFDRTGAVVAEYDKTHLLPPPGSTSPSGPAATPAASPWRAGAAASSSATTSASRS